MVRQVDPVVDFLRQAFGAKETFRTTGGAGGIHCEVRIGSFSRSLASRSALLAPLGRHEQGPHDHESNRAEEE